MRIHRSSLTVGIALLLAVVFAAPATSGTRSCTSSMVSLNICRSTADVAYCLAIGTVDPDAGGPLLPPSTTLADAFATIYNWQTPSPCTADMVAAGICNAGQIGTSVPITKAQFADLQVRNYVKEVMRRYLRQKAIEAAAVSAEAQADPDIGQ